MDYADQIVAADCTVRKKMGEQLERYQTELNVMDGRHRCLMESSNC